MHVMYNIAFTATDLASKLLTFLKQIETRLGQLEFF